MRAALGVHVSRRNRPARAIGTTWVLAVVALAVLPAVVGCGADPKTEAEREAERLAAQRERRTPPFDIDPPMAEPYADLAPVEKDDQRPARCRYKPGHWTAAVLPVKANKEDVVGELHVEMVAGRDREPVRLGDSPFTLTESRTAALPKGQKKLLAWSLFVPPGPVSASALIRLSDRKTSFRQYEALYPLESMPSHQYHFVVLARSPDRYVYLKSLPTINSPRDEWIDREKTRDYGVELVKVERRAALPDGALFWTSIAVVLWDDVDPGSLSVRQREALIDWLHWGGQLIISGPDTLDTLRGSFLEAYLPATAAGAWELTAAEFEPLNATFTLPGQSRLMPAGAWSGVRLALADGAQYVPGTGEFLAERRVGRGRVVVSAVRLSDRGLTTWPGFDGFLNACLLRRPSRRWRETASAGAQLVWDDPRLKPFDAAQNCRLRYFTRDAGVPYETYAADVIAMTAQSDDLRSIESVSAAPGVAAWRGSSPAAKHAREILQNAARVEIPTRWFVVWIVAGYLVILVPLNWLAFYGLGRVEWAWAAAPIIAVVSTAGVIRMAQLDIGFARSETALGVVELHGGYARAHLTRYTALYTSLTTRYTFEHDAAGAMIQPFRTVVRRGESLTTLTYRHDRRASLQGFVVPSNTVDLIHGEEMVALAGSLELAHDPQGRLEVVNCTGLPLQGVGVLRRGDDGALDAAWIGQLGPRDNGKLLFRAVDVEAREPWFGPEREKSVETKQSPVPGQFNLRTLIDLAEDASSLEPGAIRLVGWTDHRMPGLKIAPAAPQSRHAAVVVAHLRYAINGPPAPDVNIKEDVMKDDQPTNADGATPSEP